MSLLIRPARTSDIRSIAELAKPYVERRILLGKELVVLYESTQEFTVAELDGKVVGAGALHVFWEDLAEVRTIVVSDEVQHRGVGGRILDALIEDARRLGIARVFCLTFEVEFFRRHGFEVMRNPGVDASTYAELVRSPDEGVAEFLELASVKPNTLGNTRMIRHLAMAGEE